MTPDQPPTQPRDPPRPGRHLTLVGELLRRWDDREHPRERFTSREEEERVKRQRAASLLTLPDPPDPDPCADCPEEATA
jgi:hypothetical protein